ncbi:MAG TPA: AAA family ATPase [Bacteroidia bacterium]|nr:AAA family ATPase [Bacteroidia bacterium]
MALALLSAVAGESIFLLGAPGVAKSLIARRLKFAFKDAQAFEYLMNRFSTPDEIFGPVSIAGLKEDRYERKVEGYLPAATVVFLDEIWKAGPSIQNALLTVLNEKVYRNGAQEVKVPMKALISASNELPTRGEGLEALWDRFIVRLEVGGIEKREAFDAMISGKGDAYTDNIEAKLKIQDNVYQAWGMAIDQIRVPENVFQVIHVIRALLQALNEKMAEGDEEFYVSDRRWRKIIRLLRTSAFLNGREEVDLMDCFLIVHCIWDDEEQIEVVKRVVKEAIEKYGYKLKVNLADIQDELKEIDAEVLEETNFLKIIQKDRLRVYQGKYYQIPSHNEKYVLIQDFDGLSATSESTIYLYYLHEGNFHHEDRKSCRKGNTKTSMVIKSYHGYNETGKQHDLEMEKYEDNIKATRKPHPSTQKHFDERISKVKQQVVSLQKEIETYRTNDLKHLRVNLFVNPALAGIVESNLSGLEKELRKFDIEANRIKTYYETVADQSK